MQKPVGTGPTGLSREEHEMIKHLLILALLYAVIEVEIKIKMTRKPIIRRRR